MNGKSSRRRVLGVSLIALALALLGVGLYAATHADRPASAFETNGALQVAPSPAGPWSDTVESPWGADAMAPGDTVSGTVYLRSASPDLPDTAAMIVAAIGDVEDNQYWHNLVILDMSLDGRDLLPQWTPCFESAGLTLAGLRDCEERPSLPPPPGGNGVPFTMTIRFREGAWNRVQGATTGPFHLRFSLVRQADEPGEPTVTPTVTVSPVTPTPTAIPGTSTPMPTPTATPGTPTPTPTPTATPGTPTLTPTVTVPPVVPTAPTSPTPPTPTVTVPAEPPSSPSDHAPARPPGPPPTGTGSANQPADTVAFAVVAMVLGVGITFAAVRAIRRRS